MGVRKMVYGVDESDVDWKRLRFAYKAMIEAQEPAND